ncbi:hypothetical protein ACF0H5_006015 [Mactra antiquata]
MLFRIILISTICGLNYGHNDFDILLEDFWNWRMQNNPEFASNVGVQTYSDSVEDYSIAAIDNRKVDMEGFMQRIGALNKEAMTQKELVTYDVLADTIQTWLDGYKWKDYGPMNPINILEGLHSQLGSKAGQVKFEREEDFWKFARRIEKFAGQIPQIIERLRRAVEVGTTNNVASIAGVPERIQNEVISKYSNNQTAIPLYDPFTSTLDSKVTNTTAKTEIRNLALQNIDKLLDNFVLLNKVLEDEYIPNTRQSFGVWGLARGDEYYAACLKWQLSVNLTADEIFEIGKKEVKRINGELEKIVKKANFKGTVKEYNDHLRNNPDLFIDDPDDALDTFKSIYKNRIEPKLPDMFDNIPTKVELQIKKMTYNGPNGIYKNAAPDFSRPGVFYANVFDPVPKFDLPALLLHETGPGHHLQDSYALTVQGIPMFRKVTDFSKYFAVPLHFPFYTAYSEGWGLYSEDLGEDLGIYENDMERFGKFGLEIFRAARLVVDTGIHAKRWSKEKAIEYMTNYTAYKPAFIEREINRYSTWPAQATSYMIGKLKIQELKNYAARKLCNHNNLKEFHSVILTNGAMPLNVMEKVVYEYVDRVRAKYNIKGDCSYTWGSGVDTIHGTSLIVAITVSIIVKLF